MAKKIKKGDILLVSIIVIGVVFNFVVDFFAKHPHFLLAIPTVILLLIIWKIKKYIDSKKKIRDFNDRIASIGFDSDWANYNIEQEGYVRGCQTDKIYRKKWVLNLLKLFGNACAKCGSAKRGLDIDHFFIAKDNGGCFIMYHKDGYLVNNAIPLCQTCNRSKGKKYFDKYFNNEEIEKIAKISCELTQIINKENPNGNFIN